MSPDRNPAKARELLVTSEQLRSDLLSAVAKLDSYIEQLKAVMPHTSGARDESPPTT
jgi:hypothetical protein